MQDSLAKAGTRQRAMRSHFLNRPVPSGIRKRVNRHITQEVCPWNSPKLVQPTKETEYLPRVPTSTSTSRAARSRLHPHTVTGPSTAAPSLVELMRMTREEWDLWTRGSAIRRAGYAGLKRNVAVALGNWLVGVKVPPEAALEVLRDALEDDEPLVREHAAWALTQGGDPPAS